ncbi:MAG: hypothetical protein H8D72_00265 [Planctomycetes bacterium]|nr:hypothetical protein [Planctomycetota bacterium]
MASVAKEEAKKRTKAVTQKAANKSLQAASTKGSGSPGGSQKVRNPWAFERLEAAIEKLEGQRAELLAAMEKPENYKDASRMADLQYKQAELERDLEQKNEEWANWS